MLWGNKSTGLIWMFFFSASRDSSTAYLGGSRRLDQCETALVVIFSSEATADGPPNFCTKLLTLTNTIFLKFVFEKLHFVIQRINPNIFVPKGMYLWDRCMLPQWVWDRGYSSITLWRKLFGSDGGIPVCGRSKCKKQQYRHSNWKISTGGCTKKASEWSDPPTGPTVDHRSKKRCVYNWSWIGSWKSRIHSGNEKVTTHGSKSFIWRYRQNSWNKKLQTMWGVMHPI